MYVMLISIMILMMTNLGFPASSADNSQGPASLKAVEEESTPVPKTGPTLIPKDVVIQKLKADCQVTYSSDALLFHYGRAELKSDSYPNLKSMAEALIAAASDPQLSQIRHYYVDGHTCPIGGVELNCKLSWARANAVVDHLVKLGVPREKLIPRGYGLAYPAYPNDREETRMLNRRVVLKGDCPNRMASKDPEPCGSSDYTQYKSPRRTQESNQAPSLEDVAGLKQCSKAGTISNVAPNSGDLTKAFRKTNDEPDPASNPNSVGSQSLPGGFKRIQ
jgi:outer membrane protein OmpA-like peptidoglycan-associated protein